MNNRALILFTEMLLLATLAFAAGTGSFSGQVVKGPEKDGTKQWIYIRRRGGVRRVEISAARVKGGELRVGAEVRISATQDDTGEWKASLVEVLSASPKTQASGGLGAGVWSGDAGHFPYQGVE